MENATQGFGMAITITSEQLQNFRKGIEFHGGKCKDFILRVDDEVYTFDLKDLAEFCVNKEQKGKE